MTGQRSNQLSYVPNNQFSLTEHSKLTIARREQDSPGLAQADFSFYDGPEPVVADCSLEKDRT